MKYAFQLSNLNNDKVMALLPVLDTAQIEFAMKLHNSIDPKDIGIEIVELEDE